MNVPSVVTQHTSVLAINKQRQRVRAVVRDIEMDGQSGWHESKSHNGEGERRSKETRHLRVLGKKGVGYYNQSMHYIVQRLGLLYWKLVPTLHLG